MKAYIHPLDENNTFLVRYQNMHESQDLKIEAPLNFSLRETSLTGVLSKAELKERQNYYSSLIFPNFVSIFAR